MKISRMTKGTWGKIIAFFDLETEEGFTIKGFKIIEGNEGRFVGFPSQKNDDGEYNATVWAENNVKKEVEALANSEYEKLPESPLVEEHIPF